MKLTPSSWHEVCAGSTHFTFVAIALTRIPNVAPAQNRQIEIRHPFRLYLRLRTSLYLLISSRLPFHCCPVSEAEHTPQSNGVRCLRKSDGAYPTTPPSPYRQQDIRYRDVPPASDSQTCIPGLPIAL